MNKLVFSAGLALFFAFFSFGSAFGAIYVMIPNIPGDSTASGHEGWITLDSVQLSFGKETKSGEKSGTADINRGIGELSEITITKNLDSASAELAQASINGNSLGDLKICLADESGCYKTYDLARSFVKSWSTSGDADDRPTEEIAFVFSSIRITQFSDGKETSKAEWDRVTNTSTYSGKDASSIPPAPAEETLLQQSIPAPAEETKVASGEISVPAWMKGPVGFWADGLTSDSEFRDSIQFMIKEGLIVVPPTEITESDADAVIPGWVKGLAGFWATDQTSDQEFVNGLTFLIEKGIIVVGT